MKVRHKKVLMGDLTIGVLKNIHTPQKLFDVQKFIFFNNIKFIFALKMFWKEKYTIQGVAKK